MRKKQESFPIDQITRMETSTEERDQTPVYNVSFWNPCDEYKQIMNSHLNIGRVSSQWDYCYTNVVSKENQQKVLQTFGVSEENLKNTAIVLSPSSTVSLVNLLHFLKLQGCRKLCVLSPVYFSVTLCCDGFGLEYGVENLTFKENWNVPVEKILQGGYDCVWITSPVFSTGIYFTEEQKQQIRTLKEHGIRLVFDESLALSGGEMVRDVPVDKDTFFIYSPHKSVSINGIKFSCIVCDEAWFDDLDSWADVYMGALSQSNHDAVYHFISDNYHQECLPRYLDYTEKARNELVRVVSEYDFASISADSKGHYVMIFTDFSLSDWDAIMEMLKDLIENQHISFYPGSLNGYDKNENFCFRINLTGVIEKTTDAVRCILDALRQYA